MTGSWRGLPRLLGNTSPGSKIVVPNAAVATYIQLFRYPGHHHFFIIFSIPFYIDFGSILDPNLERKSLQNRIWSRFFQRPKLLRTIFRILKDVSHGIHGFEVPRPREQVQKSIQFREKSFQKGNTIYDIFWTYFFLNFYGFWAPSWAPFFLQNRSQDHGTVKGDPSFFEFLVLSALWGTPGTRF